MIKENIKIKSNILEFKRIEKRKKNYEEFAEKLHADESSSP